MAGALKPGGVLVATEPYLGAMFSTSTPVVASMWSAFADAASTADFRWAPKLLPTVTAAGLSDVSGSVTAELIRGGTPGAEVLALTVEAVRARVAPGTDIDSGLQHLRDPAALEPGLIWYTAWGRRP
jgi:hypothetical protein